MNSPEWRFVTESNKIEGIIRSPYSWEVDALIEFVNFQTPFVEDVERFVSVNQHGAVIRDQNGLNVYVGEYDAPQGGTHIRYDLARILDDMIEVNVLPWRTYCEYEHLHPFTDGNGRSGRALWLWAMKRAGQYEYALRNGFLNSFHYQTLENFDENFSVRS